MKRFKALTDIEERGLDPQLVKSAIEKLNYDKNAERNAAIIKDVNDGVRPTEIANKYGFSISYFYILAKKLNLPLARLNGSAINS